MTNISVVITTLNNAETLARCLSSTSLLADDLLVVDSHSTDNSVEIAQHHQARVIQRPFAGFGPQKQWAIDQAQYDWVLLLDADEALTKALQSKVTHLKQQGFVGAGYRLPRREWLAWKVPIDTNGRWQRHGVKLTDHLRLFDRKQVRLSQHAVHAAPATSQATTLLSEPLLHWGDAPFSKRREKARHYADIYADSKPTVQRWPLSVKQYLSPIWAFSQDYLLRRYFIDGRMGLAAAACSAYSCYWKYRALLNKN